MERLDGQVALVTGASRGIGAATARALRRPASGSGSPRGAAVTCGSTAPSGMVCDVRDPVALERLAAPPPSGSAASTSSSSTPASAPTAPSSTSRRTSSRR